jgi:LysR family transcriptional regulator, glycine cleavage system transcriptional activator
MAAKTTCLRSGEEPRTRFLPAPKGEGSTDEVEFDAPDTPGTAAMSDFRDPDRRGRLPPLKALQTFVSATHHLNFSRAAQELCVTAAAVSYQIRLLERSLNATLFERRPRGLHLTPAGVSLRSVCEHAFADIADAVEAIRSGEHGREIRVASMPHFSGKVLFPASLRFMAENPRWKVKIDHTLTVPEFAEAGYDFAVLFGTGDWPGLESQLLFNSPTGPTCAPSLLGRGDIAQPGDIARFPILLDDSSFQVLWIDWFRHVGATGWEKLTNIPCNDIHALLHAAEQGVGFIMEPEFMIREQLVNGTLLYPFNSPLLNYGYYLVYPQYTQMNVPRQKFRDWLVAHVSALTR